jgi:hypothetical protein
MRRADLGTTLRENGEPASRTPFDGATGALLMAGARDLVVAPAIELYARMAESVREDRRSRLEPSPKEFSPEMLHRPEVLLVG